jgi:hypothetical protein
MLSHPLSSLLLFALVGCAATSAPPAPAPLTPLTTIDDVHRLVVALNAVERFPTPRDALQQATGLELPAVFVVGQVSVLLGGADLVEVVKISSAGTAPPPPVPPGALSFDQTSYAYLPTVQHVERVGSVYRALEVRHRVVGPGERELDSWTYRVDEARGPYVTEAEKDGLRELLLGFIAAVREDRFEDAYADFQRDYPADPLGAHPAHGASIVIRAFDDRVPGRGDPFLAEDGLIAYVGIHVHPQQGSSMRYPMPWLFEAFGVSRIDARRYFLGRPYNPIDNGAPSPHAMDGAFNPVPDLSAAGHRDGGMAFYSFLEWRGDGWTFEHPGAYPHEGSTAPIDLDPALLQVSSVVLTHSRPRDGAQRGRASKAR